MKYKLYNNTVELEYIDKSHLYLVDNKKVDGVTSVLGVINKPALMYWAVNQSIGYLQENLKAGVSYDEMQIKSMLDTAKTAHRTKKEEAANVGQMVHDWIEQYVKGQNPKPFVNEMMKKSCDKFVEWAETYKIKFLESEKIIYSKRMNYAGTFDFLAEVKGKLWIGDIKTSNGIWDEYWFQTAAYRQAYTEEYKDRKIAGEVIVRVGKDDAAIEVKTTKQKFVTPYWINRNTFNHALGLYRTLNQLKDYKYAEKNGKIQK